METLDSEFAYLLIPDQYCNPRNKTKITAGNREGADFCVWRPLNMKMTDIQSNVSNKFEHQSYIVSRLARIFALCNELLLATGDCHTTSAHNSQHHNPFSASQLSSLLHSLWVTLRSELQVSISWSEGECDQYISGPRRVFHSGFLSQSHIDNR